MTQEQIKTDMKSDLDWIFDNGEQVLKETNDASIATLAKCFGLTDLWGDNGECITYCNNVMTTLNIAKPFLKAGDKKGWLNYCETIKGNNNDSRTN